MQSTFAGTVLSRCLAKQSAPAVAVIAGRVGGPGRGGSSCRRSLSHVAGTSTDQGLVKTALYDWHTQLGGDMVPFAGYCLPVLYKNLPDNSGGVMKEHLWCRDAASLFDVSHMGQIRWHGADRVKFLERIVVGDIAGLAEGSGCLSLITNENGGILDDTVITNAGDHIYMVVNGATKFDDMAHFEKELAAFGGDVHMEYLHDTMQLLAVQGPRAAQAVQSLLPADFDLTQMAFMTGTNVTLDGGGVEGCRITRCGYTGEDGFEIAVPADHAVSIAEKLVGDYSTVHPAGLGARDSLRLEAGLCLYGHDLDDTIKPTEASLGWTIGPPASRRRVQGGFLGADKILTSDGKFRKTARKRVGMTGMKSPAREGAEIYDEHGQENIGVVTSGTYSPCLKAPIAMGYVTTDHSKVGTNVQLKVRGKMQPAKITAMPFVVSNYYRVPT